MKLIIMKFGGTSVSDASAITKVIKLIKNRKVSKSIVVVSAIAKATNTLTCMAKLSANNELEECKKIFTDFKKKHMDILLNLVINNKLYLQTKKKLDTYFIEISDCLEYISLKSHLSDHMYAKIVSYGELLSSNIIHSAMLELGVNNTLIDARQIIITNKNYANAKPIMTKINKIMPSIIYEHLKDKEIILTQGFIANTSNGIPTTLGREGSDYTAALIGMVMNSDEIQIWTDVNGIMSANPTVVNNPSLISEISFLNAAELSALGAKVLHPLTIYPAIKKEINVRILNSRNSDVNQIGTLITSNPQCKKLNNISITYKESICILQITSKLKIPIHFLLKKIIYFFEKNEIKIEAINVTSINISLIIKQQDMFNKIVDEFSKLSIININTNQSMIGIIGSYYTKIHLIYSVLSKCEQKISVFCSTNESLILLVKQQELINIINELHEKICTQDS